MNDLVHARNAALMARTYDNWKTRGPAEVEPSDTDIANETQSRLESKVDDELRAGESWIADHFRELAMANETAVKIAALSVRCAELPEDHPAHDFLSELVEQAKADAISFRIACATKEERQEIERGVIEDWAEV